MTLEESWSSNDQHGVTVHVSARLEEQWHVQHDDSGPGERPATQPDISSLSYVRMHDGLQPPESSTVGEHPSSQCCPVDRVAGHSLGKGGQHGSRGRSARRGNAAGHGIRIEYWHTEAGTKSRCPALSHRDGTGKSKNNH